MKRQNVHLLFLLYIQQTKLFCQVVKRFLNTCSFCIYQVTDQEQLFTDQHWSVDHTWRSTTSKRLVWH